MPRAATVLLWTAALTGAALAGCASAHHAGPATIDAGVLEAVRGRDSVSVMVILAMPTGEDDAGASRSAEIAAMQDAVLQGLEPGQYRVGRRFESVPALTLTVYDEAAIHALSRHEHVRRIGLDEGGGTGGAP